ncbi:hypothetical protein AGMMS49957_05440 [Synergistales bacterium]|nr:hypothetical protein AGMMS49957_05440 [Synergistales bacterium]
MRPTRKATLWVFAILMFLLFRGAGDHALLDPIEGLNASVTLNMATRGDLFVPRAGDFFYTGKAMGFWWLSALCLKILGWSEAAVRFWPVIGGLGMAAGAWFIARRLKSERVANFAAILTGSALLTYAASQIASPHTLYSLLTTGALVGFIYGTSDNRFFLLTHAASALGFIAYGPAGLLLPWLSFLIYAYATGEWNALADALFYWPGVLATIFLVDGYLVLMYMNHPALLALMRYMPRAAAFNTFGNALLFLAFGAFPWCGIAGYAIKDALPLTWREVRPHEKNNALLVIWIAVFSFFGLFSGDAFLITAVIPPLAALSSLCVAKIIEESNNNNGNNDYDAARRMMIWECSFFGVFVIVVLPWFYFGATASLRGTLLSLVPWIGIECLFLAFGLRCVKKREMRKIMLQLSVAALLSLLPLAGVFDLLAENLSIRPNALWLKEEVKTGDKIVQYGMNNPSLYFYTARESILFEARPLSGVAERTPFSEKALVETWEGPARVFLIVAQSDKIRPLGGSVHNVYDDARYIILSNQNGKK